MITETLDGYFTIAELDEDGTTWNDHTQTATKEDAIEGAIFCLTHQAHMMEDFATDALEAAKTACSEAEELRKLARQMHGQLEALSAYLDPERYEDAKPEPTPTNGLSADAHRFASAIEAIEKTNPEAARMFVQAMERLAGGAQ